MAMIISLGNQVVGILDLRQVEAGSLGVVEILGLQLQLAST